jgi:hypothetical protein
LEYAFDDFFGLTDWSKSALMLFRLKCAPAANDRIPPLVRNAALRSDDYSGLLAVIRVFLSGDRFAMLRGHASGFGE